MDTLTLVTPTYMPEGEVDTLVQGIPVEVSWSADKPAVYAFEATAGQPIIFQVEEMNVDVAAVKIFDPDGVLLSVSMFGHNDWNDPAALAGYGMVWPEKDGRHLLVFRSHTEPDILETINDEGRLTLSWMVLEEESGTPSLILEAAGTGTPDKFAQYDVTLTAGEKGIILLHAAGHCTLPLNVQIVDSTGDWNQMFPYQSYETWLLSLFDPCASFVRGFSIPSSGDYSFFVGTDLAEVSYNIMVIRVDS